MKDKRFEGMMIPIDKVSYELMEIISLVTNEEYDEALNIVDDYISQNKDTEKKNIAAMIFLQILALAGYRGISSILLESLHKRFGICSKARNMCKRTIRNI